MAKTRDEKFKLSFDTFIKDTVGIQDYYIQNLTKNKCESTHIYEFIIRKQNIIMGYIDRKGIQFEVEHIINNNLLDDERFEPLEREYIPNKEDFEEQFETTFDPYRHKVEIPQHDDSLRPYIYHNSFVNIVKMEYNEDNDIYGKLCVVYYKKHIPYPVEYDKNEYERKYIKLLNCYDRKDNELSIALNDIDELQDDLIHNERQLRIYKKKLNREITNNQLSETNLINKLHEMYNLSPKKEECPVCYETMENDKLVIPRCSHYICGDCHIKCDSCPICRLDYTD